MALVEVVDALLHHRVPAVVGLDLQHVAGMNADQLGHARISMTQDVYLGRRAVSPELAAALESP